MAASRAAKTAFLAALMFAPAPSFPGAEFGLAAPVILPQQNTASFSAVPHGSCRASALNNTYDLAAAFGGAAPVPAPAPQRRDNVPPGLASLLQAAEMAQHSGRSAGRPDAIAIQQPGQTFAAPPGSSPNTSFTWVESDLPAGASSSFSDSASAPVLPGGVPNFLAFLRESGSMFNFADNSAMGPFGCNQSSALQQLVLLQHWIPLLDRMAPVHKNLLWETCKTFPGFRLTTPKLTSYRKMVTAWGANIAVYMPNVSALFAAIGYLKHHDILKSEFYFPNTQQPVFRTFVPSAAPAYAPMRASAAPVVNSLKRPSIQMATPSPPAASPPASPPVAAPLSPFPQDDRGRDRSPDVEDAPAPHIKRSRVMNIATLTDSNSGN